MSGDDARDQALLEFLGAFESVQKGSSPPQTISDLDDGVVLFEALAEIAPHFFEPTSIARHLGDNYVLKHINLRKLVRNMEQYFRNDLRLDTDFAAIDIQARPADPAAFVVLGELVTAAAVSCEEKQKYVGHMRNMEPASQQAMQEIIQTGLGRLSEYVPAHVGDEDEDENEMVFGQEDDDDTTPRAADDGADETQRNLFGANHHEELDQQLSDLRRELATQKAQAATAAEDSERAQEKLRSIVDDLQGRIVERQDQLINVEEELGTANRDLDETKSRLAAAEEKKATLEDDLELANAKAQQVHQTEAMLAAYKKKLDGVEGMNQQMTDLEEQAANYLGQIMELESEVKKSNALQRTVNDLQEKVTRLEKDKSNTASSTESAAVETAEVKRQLTQALKDKKMYEEEIAELRAQQAVAANGGLPSPARGVSLAASAGEGVSAEQREKTMRLEIENKKLQEEVAKLKSAAVAATAVSEVSKPPAPPSDATPMAVAVSADDTADVVSLKSEIERMTEDIAKKDKINAKIASDKDKLEAYTKKTLAKFQDKYLVALQECKAKLKEKQDKIEILEGRIASERSAQKREERLLSATIYELGLAIMQNRLRDGR